MGFWTSQVTGKFKDFPGPDKFSDFPRRDKFNDIPSRLSRNRVTTSTTLTTATVSSTTLVPLLSLRLLSHMNLGFGAAVQKYNLTARAKGT